MSTGGKTSRGSEWRSLLAAVEGGHADFIRQLIKANVSLEAADCVGRTAVDRSTKAVIPVLLVARLSAHQHLDNTSLHYATALYWPTVAQFAGSVEDRNHSDPRQ
jgi:hypothetical protein